MKANDKKFISLWAPASFRRKLDARAKKLGISRSQAGLILIEKGLRSKSEQRSINIIEATHTIEDLRDQISALKAEARRERKKRDTHTKYTGTVVEALANLIRWLEDRDDMKLYDVVIHALIHQVHKQGGDHV